jgi:hypothetical protein
MLFNGDRVVCTAFVDVVISHKHALLAIDRTNTSNNVTGRNTLVVTSKLADLEER